jgi:hypothetical protein
MRVLLTIFFAAMLADIQTATAQTPPSSSRAEPKPLIRETHTGYLLHCTFRAIRPYIWKQQPLLTGWETDASGGAWEGRPSGFFPQEFGFHVESFRLKDTDTQHAVTIRHQIARQTEGKITLAYRFMADGALGRQTRSGQWLGGCDRLPIPAPLD